MARYAEAHKSPKGPGDARPTAKQIILDEGLQGKLSDKIFLVTGCSSGIGIETARALHETGAHLFLTARDSSKIEAVRADILKAGGSGKIDLLHLDLSSLSSVRQCADAFLAKSKQLNALVLNAGVMASPEGRTEDGFETQFGTNHLGHFLLFQLLLPTLLSSSTSNFNSRVVVLSSSNHRLCGIEFDDLDLKKGGYQPFKAYGQSKTANVYMANEIDRRYGAKGLHATSVHPGGIGGTELVRHMDPALMQSMMTKHTLSHLKSSEQGSATTVWATVSRDWEGKGGKFLEDCQIGEPHDSGAPDAAQPLAAGYAPHAYDEAKEKRLWDESLQLVGLA